MISTSPRIPAQNHFSNSNSSNKNINNNNNNNNLSVDNSTKMKTDGQNGKTKLNPNGVPIAHEEYGTDVMMRALESFQYIEDNEYLGTADGLAMQEESMKCQCQYNLETDDRSDACGDACINRMLYVECSPRDCPVGDACLNRRLQKKEYAPIEIFQTESKGFGMKAKETLAKNTFVIEYIGEVVTSTTFRKRTKQYDLESEKHLYCMSLKTDQVIDATRRGGIARFINHSCDPNCELQKWVVGKHLRMGIFTKRIIEKGEELSFDYKFERYGAPCQVCLCGSKNCKGTIGVQKSLSSGGKQPDLDDESDEDDLDVNNNDRKSAQARGLESTESVTDFCKSFVQSSTKFKRVNQLLDRLIATSMITCLRKFIQLHGIFLLKFSLKPFMDNQPVCRKILTILSKLPIATKNTINDSKILEAIQPLMDHKDPLIQTLAQKLNQEWSKLETVYRIPKAPKSLSSKLTSPETHKRSRTDSTTSSVQDEGEVYGGKRYKKDRYSHGRNSSSYTPPGDDQSKGPEPFSAPTDPLPPHWSFAHDSDGKIYYYNTETLITQWEHPTKAKDVTHKVVSNGVPQDILDRIAQQAHKAVEEKKEKYKQHLKERKERVKEKEQREKGGEKDKYGESRKSKEKNGNVGGNSSTNSLMSKRKSIVEIPSVEITEDVKRSLRDEISVVVIKYLSRYKSEINPEDFKKHARKITHSLIEKAAKNSEDQLNEEMKKKIKKFVESYMDKVKSKSGSSD